MVQKDAEFYLNYDRLTVFGCDDHWHWSSKYKSKAARIYGNDKRTVCFHPHWSNGTAGIMGTTAINKGASKFYFWEIQISDRIFGTSTMFGIGTKRTCLHMNSFINIVGNDNNSWGLSHKGYLYHNGKRQQFCRPFRENEPTKIGVLYDHSNGNLCFYKDGKFLGIAFTGLNEIEENLYPIISSTAAKTEIVLKNARRDFINLQERCKYIIKSRLTNGATSLRSLNLPSRLLNYIQSELDDDDDEQSENDNDDNDDNNNDHEKFSEQKTITIVKDTLPLISATTNVQQSLSSPSSSLSSPIINKRILFETLRTSYTTLTMQKRNGHFFNEKGIIETVDLTL